MPELKVTVLMPAYNAGRFIAEAISSVLAQTFRDFELLIINDGSTDNTLMIIKSFKDDRIKVITQKNKGVSAALNTGLANAGATYIARFDADDICYPERLQVQYDFITAHPDYQIIGSAADYVDVKGVFVFTHHPAAHTSAEIRRLSFKVCPFIHSSVLYKKDVIVGAGGYNENAYTYEDHFLWASILPKYKTCNLPNPLIKVRLNPDSITIDEKWHTNKFRSIKFSTLKKRKITPFEGNKLMKIGFKQFSANKKQGAYYALCGKKYLLNNYQPEKARQNIFKAIFYNPFRFDNYLLYGISFLPERLIARLHAFNLSINTNLNRA